MVSKKVIISNPSGLHARPASILAQAAGKCSSEVLILYNNRTIQAKSVLNIMAVAVKAGAEVEVQCSGEKEQEDLETIAALIESGLGE